MSPNDRNTQANNPSSNRRDLEDNLPVATLIREPTNLPHAMAYVEGEEPQARFDYKEEAEIPMVRAILLPNNGQPFQLPSGQVINNEEPEAIPVND